jgi:NTE family protein
MRRNTRSIGTTRGVVLGAGGFLGGMWSLGALAAIQQVTDLDVSEVDLMVGTSAGSVLAMLLRSNLTVDDLYAAHARPDPPDTTAIPGDQESAAVDTLTSEVPAIPTSDLSWPGLPRLGIGSLPLLTRSLRRPLDARFATWCAALAPRGRGRLTDVGNAIRRLHDDRHWPTGTLVTATDYVTGERTVFGYRNGSQVAPAQAVMASCAVPAWYEPVPINGVPHIDGAVYSACNADLALGCDEVYVLAPMAALEPDRPTSPLARLERWWRRQVTTSTLAEVERLKASGASVRLLTPNADDLAVMGTNMMDAGRAQDVLLSARDSVLTGLRGTPVRRTGRRTAAAARRSIPAVGVPVASPAA